MSTTDVSAHLKAFYKGKLWSLHDHSEVKLRCKTLLLHKEFVDSNPPLGLSLRPILLGLFGFGFFSLPVNY